jgi:hypothetical protein
MPWNAVAPGRFLKLLSADPDSGAATGISLNDPHATGFQAQPRAHYHFADEEILCLGGRFTFDGDNWLGRYSYLFHPAGLVHGHRSVVPEPYTMISRASGRLTWTYLDKPAEPQPYMLPNFAPSRQYALHVDPKVATWRPAGLAGSDASEMPLGDQPHDNARSLLLRLPARWSGVLDLYRPAAGMELLVLEGAIKTDDGRDFRAGCYNHSPANIALGDLTSAQGALLYLVAHAPEGLLTA